MSIFEDHKITDYAVFYPKGADGKSEPEIQYIWLDIDVMRRHGLSKEVLETIYAVYKDEISDPEDFKDFLAYRFCGVYYDWVEFASEELSIRCFEETDDEEIAYLDADFNEDRDSPSYGSSLRGEYYDFPIPSGGVIVVRKDW